MAPPTWDQFIQNANNASSFSSPSSPVSNPAAPGMPPIPQINYQPPDYNQMIESAIQPYREMAAQLNSPYGAINQNGWLARNHPGIAGGLDNALIAMANTGQGHTIGETISNAARGAMAPMQFHRQQMLQSAMLPYEMAQPRISMMYQLAQMNKRSAQTQAELQRIPYEEAMEQRAMAQGDWYMHRMGEQSPEQMKISLAARSVGVDPNNPSAWTAAQASQVQDALRTQTQKDAFSNNFLAQMTMGANPRLPNETEAQYDARIANAYATYQGQEAGTRTGAVKGAEQPFTNLNDEINSLQKAYVPPKIMSAKEYYDAHPTAAANDMASGKSSMYDAYSDQARQSAQQDRTSYTEKVHNYAVAKTRNPNLSWDQFNQSSSQTQQSGSLPPGWLPK